MIGKCLLGAVMALALLIGSPADTQAPTLTPPADTIGRAKFPLEDAALIDGLAFVNKIVNQSIQPVPDKQQYGVDDKMESWPESGKGDCEDYALSKLVTLGNAGVPIVIVARLRFVMVKTKQGNFGHAILEMRLPRGGIVFLDNRFENLMTRPELEAAGYKFFDW